MSDGGAGRTQLSVDPVVDVVLAEALAAGPLPAVVAVIDDADAAFVQPLLDHGAREVRIFSDFSVEALLPKGVRQGSPAGGLFDGVSLVVGRLPKALAELEDLAECASRQVAVDARLILGAREKHLTHSMNESLGKYFAEVRGTRGMRKSRAIVASRSSAGDASVQGSSNSGTVGEPSPASSRPRAGGSVAGGVASARTFPRTAYLDELDLTVAARGGAFAGTTLDLGTRALLETLSHRAPEFGIDMRGPSSAAHASPAVRVQTAVDLGCGTGLLASVLARSFPEAKVFATDASWWACASAAATAKANGLGDRIQVVRGNAGEGIPDGSVDLVLCNPPFHAGRQVDPGLANELFRGAARMLQPGGQLVTVFNSHLKHRHHLDRIVGATQQLARTEKFTVTVSTRR